MHRLACLSLSALALALPVAATAAASAEAAINTYDYAVTIAGTADYNRADVDGDVTAQHDISLDFKTTIPEMRFVKDAVEDSKGALGTATVNRGHYVIRGEGGSLNCTDHSISGVAGGGLDASYSQGGIIFATRVIDAFDVDMACGPPVGGWKLPFGSEGQEVGVGIFDGAFTMPNSMIGQGSMVFPLKGDVSGSSCPFNHFNTVLCSLTWEATVTFTRIGEDVLEDPPIDEVPLVDDLIVPMTAKAKLAPDLRSAVLPVTCAQACSGRLTASVKGETLARKAFTVAAGRTTAARLRFDAADRQAIRKAGKVKLALEARSGGETLRRAITLRG